MYVDGAPETKITTYVVVDDQSNCSLGKSQLVDRLDPYSETFSYTLRTCAGTTQMEGRRAKGLVIEPLEGDKKYLLPL